MSVLSQALIAAADRNRDLLNVLSQTDNAPSSLKQSVAYIADLKAQIAKNDKELVKLHAITEDERKDHVKYRDSTVKRFAYKLGGQKGKDKFAGKQEKEEREFLEAWQREREAKEAHDEMTAALQHAESDRQTFEADSAKHEQAQNELDVLYASIFTGPTPEVPGEDEAERNVQLAGSEFERYRNQAGAEQHALGALRSARDQLASAQLEMSRALDASTWDMWGGGTFADMMEREALSRAQNFITQGLRHMNEAMRAQPAIRNLDSVNIDHGHFVSDVLFDNIFSDMRQHERIENSTRQLYTAIEQLKGEWRSQSQRVEAADSRVQQASEGLKGARQDLQRIRADAFQSFTDAGGPPPTYQQTG